MSKYLPKLWYMLEGPPSRAVLLTIRNLKLEVKLNPIRTYLGEHLEPSFVRKNPLHTVPFFEDNGFYITDSHAITQYLVETRAPASTFIGHTVKERAVLNDRLYFDGFLFQKMKAAMSPIFRGNLTDVPDDKKNELNAALDIFDHLVRDGQWFALDRITIADFHAIPTISTLLHANFDLNHFENIANWYDRCKTIPGVEENEEGAKLFGDKVQSNLSDSSSLKKK